MFKVQLQAGETPFEYQKHEKRTYNKVAAPHAEPVQSTYT